MNTSKEELHELLDRPIVELDIRTSTGNALNRVGILYIGQLVPYVEEELLKIPGIGQGGACRILYTLWEALRRRGFYHNNVDVSDWKPPR